MNNNSIETLIKEIKALISTMEEVMLAENATIGMGSWVQRVGTQHFCNSCCCIVGYHMLKRHPEDSTSSGLSSFSEEYVQDLEDELNCKSCSSLFYSIYYGCAGDRGAEAMCSNLFTVSEINSFVHLNSDDTTPKDVIEYMQACLVKLEEKL